MSAQQVGPFGMTAFVPNGSGDLSRRDLSILLLGAARDAGMDDTRAVRAVPTGFWITDELADLLYDEQDENDEVEDDDEQDENDEVEDDEPPAKPKKTSGNRAAKASTTEQE